MKSFYSGSRKRLVKAKQFHALLNEDDWGKLTRLTHAWKMSAADVLRELLRKAKP